MGNFCEEKNKCQLCKNGFKRWSTEPVPVRKKSLLAVNETVAFLKRLLAYWNWQQQYKQHAVKLTFGNKASSQLKPPSYKEVKPTTCLPDPAALQCNINFGNLLSQAG